MRRDHFATAEVERPRTKYQNPRRREPRPRTRHPSVCRRDCERRERCAAAAGSTRSVSGICPSAGGPPPKRINVHAPAATGRGRGSPLSSHRVRLHGTPRPSTWQTRPHVRLRRKHVGLGVGIQHRRAARVPQPPGEDAVDEECAGARLERACEPPLSCSRLFFSRCRRSGACATRRSPATRTIRNRKATSPPISPSAPTKTRRDNEATHTNTPP